MRRKSQELEAYLRGLMGPHQRLLLQSQLRHLDFLVPVPCMVQEDAEQRPVAVTLYGVSVPVESIEERWEDGEFWWRDNPVVRTTYQVTLEDGPEGWSPRLKRS